MLVSVGFIFAVLYFAFPSIFQSRFPLDTIFLVTVGFGCGLPALWMNNTTRMIRREIPQDSRRGQRIDEPLSEYRDY